METHSDPGRAVPTPSAPEQQQQQQHPHAFRPVVSPLARAHSNTSLGPVVTPTKGGAAGHLGGARS